MSLLELQATVEGRVQGVGFRATVKLYARQLHLKGIVFNTADGNVKIFAQGPSKDLAKLMELLQQNSGSALIEKVTVEYKPITKEYEDFTIL